MTPPKNKVIKELKDDENKNSKRDKVTHILKRNGNVVAYNSEKIFQAIWNAVQVVGGKDNSLAKDIAAKVEIELNKKFHPRSVPAVEEVQDIVEKVLIESGHAKTAKEYILYRFKRAREREVREVILGSDKASDNLNFSNNALEVLTRRYLLKDENGEIKESPKQMIERVANNIAKADKSYGATKKEIAEIEAKFFDMIASLEFMPNSPTLMNAGTEIQQLSACFVLPVPDSIVGIFDALKYQALIHKSGGGTGFSFSRLRPKSDIVKSTSGVSSGPVSFMKIFDAATQQIKQGGKRRGANMGILRVDHPDILDFITCKADMKTLTNFNISVAITDAFMNALKNNGRYELLNPRSKEVIKTLPAKEVFNLIVSNAWINGDPGIVFIDNINKTNPLKNLGEIEATNPCGEQDLHPYDSCNLGSIAVNRFVKEDRTDFDWNRLAKTVHTATHFLDNVIDMNNFPIPQIEEMSKKSRRIGLGIMGFADALYLLGIAYDSPKGFETGKKLMRFLREEAEKESMELAEKRGVFEAYEGSDQEKEGKRVRNAYLTTVAPTGTIGMIAEASGGLEPNFALSYIKYCMDGDELVYTNKYFEQEAKDKGFYSNSLMAKIARVGTIQDFEEIPKEVRDVFVTAQDISPENHIRMQAAFQESVDAAVSKTINFPNSSTMEEIEKGYLLAYELKCKGVTIYRDGSRDGQVLNIGTVKKDKCKTEINIPKVIKIEEMQEVKSKAQIKKEGKCPECGTKLAIEEGCAKCYGCGYSACSV